MDTNPSAAPNIVVRQIEDHDMPSLVRFYRRHFADRPRLNDMTLWHWEFVTHPRVTRRRHFFIIDVDGEIEGGIGYVPLRLQTRGQEVDSCHPVNYFVNLKYKGLPALRLFKTVLSEYPTVIGGYFSSDAAKLIEKLGFVNLSAYVRSYHTSVSCLASSRAHSAQRTVRMMLIATVRHVWTLMLNGIFAVVSAGSLRHATANAIDPGFEALGGRGMGQRNFILKDGAYLRWRYEQSPALHCIFIHQYHQNMPDAMAVLHVDAVLQEAVILDILGGMLPLKRTVSLVLSILHYCRSQRVALLTTHLLNADLDKALRLCGFASDTSDIGLTVYARDPDVLAGLAEASEWHYVMGDTDRY
jgi:hypothetical protein